MIKPYLDYLEDKKLWGVWHDKSVYPWALPAVVGRTKEEARDNFFRYMFGNYPLPTLEEFENYEEPKRR